MKKEIMKRAWEIRKSSAKKFNCKISEIDFSYCLCLAWANSKGFVSCTILSDTKSYIGKKEVIDIGKGNYGMLSFREIFQSLEDNQSLVRYFPEYCDFSKEIFKRKGNRLIVGQLPQKSFTVNWYEGIEF